MSSAMELISKVKEGEEMKEGETSRRWIYFVPLLFYNSDTPFLDRSPLHTRRPCIPLSL
jgi:hypothetical protein